MIMKLKLSRFDCEVKFEGSSFLKARARELFRSPAIIVLLSKPLFVVIVIFFCFVPRLRHVVLPLCVACFHSS